MPVWSSEFATVSVSSKKREEIIIFLVYLCEKDTTAEMKKKYEKSYVENAINYYAAQSAEVGFFKLVSWVISTEKWPVNKSHFMLK